MLNEKRASSLMNKYSVDYLVASTSENVYYTTGFKSFLKQLSPLSLVFGIHPLEKEHDPSLVTSYSEADIVATSSELRAKNIGLYGSFPIVLSEANIKEIERKLLTICTKSTRQTNAISTLVKTLEQSNAQSSTIGLDEAGLPYGMFEEIAKALPKAKIIPANKIFSEIRAVKTESEITKIRNVVKVTEDAIRASMEKEGKRGSTTRRIGRAFDEFVWSSGAKPNFTVVAAAGLSAFPNSLGDDETLENGDFIRYDVGCTLDGYLSDLGRTFAFSSPPQKISEFYDATLKGLKDAMKAIAPGVRASAIFDIAVESIRKNGIKNYERHHTGHGIGIEVYEPPLIGPLDNTILEEGMVINLETPYYELGVGGLLVEDCLVVRKNGYELFSEHLGREFTSWKE